MRRPLIELSLLMWMIIFVTAQINIDILRLGGLGLVLAGLSWWALCYKKGGQSYKCKVFICLVLVLVLFMELVNIQFLKVEALETMEGEYEAVGIVTDIRAHKTTIKNVKAYERSGLQDTSGKRLPKLLVKHKWGMKADWKVGDEVRVYGYISKFDDARNPKTFSPRNFYNGQGIPLYLNVEEKGGLVTSKDAVLAAVEEIRGRLVGKMDILLSEEDSALLKGIMLGEDDSIDDQTLEGFRLTGTAHILAVSGLHFGILYMFLSKLLIQIKCPYKGALAISCLVMFVFVVITGMSFSAIRAFGMICIHMLAVFTKRKYDLLNALGLVALISMLACPYIIWQVGFQLSFWAVFCIGSFMKLKIYAQTHVTYVKLERLELLIFPLYIQGMLTPLMVFHFNRLNLYGPFFNIPTAILMPFVLLTGVFFLLIGGFPLVGGIATLMCESFLASLRALTGLVWKLPYNSLVVGSPSVTAMALFFTLVSVTVLSFQYRVWLMHHRSYFIRGCILGLIMILVVEYLPVESALKIDFLDVGQGDAVLIHGRDDQKILIDSGPQRADLTDILLKQGITRIDYAFLSHPDADHATGFEEMAGKIGIETFYYGELTEKEEVVDNLKRLYPKAHFIQLDRGDKLHMGDVSFTVLHPSNTLGKGVLKNMDANNMSLVLMMTYKTKTFMFTGDIEKESENDILKKWSQNEELINVDLLKVGHHGSKTSTTEEFIQATSPKYAVIQVGKNNFGHPSQITLQTLADSEGIKGEENIYRNDSQGCIRVIVEEDIRIIPWLTSRRQTWYNR